MPPRIAAPLSLFIVAFFACVVPLTACGASQREKTITASVTLLNAARDGFTVYSRKHQDDLVEASATIEEAHAAVAKWRQEREHYELEFKLGYDLLKVATKQNDEPSLRAAAQKAVEIAATIKQLIGGK